MSLDHIYLSELSEKDFTVVGNLFPPKIRNELKSDLKGRTVLILVEIAYQFPTRSNMSYISKSLAIPFQTVSYEIKRLIELKYI